MSPPPTLRFNTQMTPDELPIADPHPEHLWRRQRDAALRNEEAIAAAAARLFRAHGVSRVEIREIAAEAGVGVGTVYRRFGDKANLIAAIIGEQEEALQTAVLTGPPPLGPGAPAEDRLTAFLRALCELTEGNLEIVLASERAAAGARYRIGAYKAWRLHLTVLLGAIDDRLDVEWLAELLLAALAGEHYQHQRKQQGMSAGRIAENIVELARKVTTC